MRRIIHLLNGLNVGGKERCALRLAQRSLSEGYDTRLILFDTPFRSAELDFDPGDIATEFIPRRAGFDFAFASKLGKLLRRKKIDIVHAHNDTALVYASFASCLAGHPRPQVIATFHTWPSHGGKAARLLTQIAGRRATAIAVSDELRNRLLCSGWLRHCATIWNGVDTDLYTPDGTDGSWRDRLGVGSEDVLVGLVARFDPIKRHEDLLAAASLLNGHSPNIIFALVGQGPLLQSMKERAAVLPSVRFVSHVQDMPSLMRSLDVLVLCSAHEASPLVLLEGIACGVPVVASAVGGIPHLLGGEPNAPGALAGRLVIPYSPQELAKALQALACDKAERVRLGAAARDQALRFSFEIEWQSYQAHYARASKKSNLRLL